jgi:hypothetical protein
MKTWLLFSGVVGGAKGAGKGARNRRDVISRCLAGRGYGVLS